MTERGSPPTTSAEGQTKPHFGSLWREQLGDCCEQSAAMTVSIVERLEALLDNLGDVLARVNRIKLLEREADEVIRKGFDRLRAMTLPLGEALDLSRLFSRLDSLIDAVDHVAEFIQRNQVASVPDDARSLVGTLSRAVVSMRSAVRGLLTWDDPERAREACLRVTEHEHAADILRREALERLFRSDQDNVSLLQNREIYEYVEEAIDRCADVANSVDALILKDLHDLAVRASAFSGIE
jgi:uncharacterized protein Yka (UPF0111/DUF47 family)